MESDRKIGKVVSVNTLSAVIELDSDLQSFVKNSYHGTHRIGLINSYIIIPIGADKIVGMVHSVSLNEETELNYINRASLILPRSKRVMKVTMIGSIVTKKVESAISKSQFEYGIVTYPQLDNPVWSVSENELEVIFRTNENEPKNLITLGKSSIFPDYDVKLDMDNFFGKHAAILGNTGSGKSCTVTAIIRSVLEDKPEMQNAHFVIFDTNNEYEKAFTNYDETGTTVTNKHFNRLVIRDTGFVIPHWLMNWQDYEALFTPAGQIQAPILANSLRRARSTATSNNNRALQLLHLISNAILRIREFAPQTNGAVTHNIRSQCIPFTSGTVHDLASNISATVTDFDFIKYEEAFNIILSSIPDPGANSRGLPNWVAIDPQQELTIDTEITKIGQYVTSDRQKYQETGVRGDISVDTPSSFTFEDFVRNQLEFEIQEQERNSPRIRNDIGTLLLRINRLFEDSRYAFLFQTLPFDNALSFFLRYILGESPLKETDTNNQVSPPWKQYYKDQHPSPVDTTVDQNNRHNVTIVDFSGIASDVLENTTALVGRLIFEFMQRIENRGSFPVVLVLEEAHHYIPEDAQTSRQERARQVFERIAKEGRKFGLSLLIASQRPSELSRTVMAQCNSFIVHRIQNPEDQQYFRSVVSSVSHDLLNQLPTLPQQSALVMGDCVTAPVQVNIRAVNPKPNSSDPSFSKEWSKINFVPPDFEKIASEWESGK